MVCEPPFTVLFDGIRVEFHNVLILDMNVERYSEAQHFALVFIFKNEAKVKKNKDEKIGFWYKYGMNFIFTSLESWKIGNAKNIYFYGELLLFIQDEYENVARLN